jgi:hypothetical protein
MKQTIRLVIIAAMLALTLPVMAQTPAAAAPAAAAAGECTDEAKAALYTEFLNNRKGKDAEHPQGDQDVAYNAAKKYMALCPTDDSAQAQYMKKWMASYEVGDRKARFLAAYDKKDYPTMMTVGKTVLADDPNYTRGYVLLGYIGYLASLGKNTSLNAESGNYAKQAITMIESGKTPDDWRPFVNKEDTLAWLNYALGFMVRDTSQNDAISYFMKAAKVESALKKNPVPYFLIAEGYETLYAKQEAEYTRLYKDKPETPESKLAAENINQMIDRVIDAYARAVALSTASDAATQDKKKEWLARLTELYKFRTKTDGAGVTELVAGILAKPLPEMPKPITSLPTPPATGATTPPAGTAPGVTTTTPPAKPAVTTTPAPKPTAPAPTQAAKPKPKANHRRR